MTEIKFTINRRLVSNSGNKFFLFQIPLKYHSTLLQVLTKDSVTVSVDAVVYYRVSNATVSVANVENAHHSTRSVVVRLLV